MVPVMHSASPLIAQVTDCVNSVACILPVPHGEFEVPAIGEAADQGAPSVSMRAAF